MQNTEELKSRLLDVLEDFYTKNQWRDCRTEFQRSQFDELLTAVIEQVEWESR